MIGILAWEDKSGTSNIRQCEYDRVDGIGKLSITLDTENCGISQGDIVAFSSSDETEGPNSSSQFQAVSHHYIVRTVSSNTFEIVLQETISQADLDTIVQQLLPSSTDYIRDYNSKLARGVVSRNSTAVAITTIGGVIHATSVEYKFLDPNLLVTSELNSTLHKHIQFNPTILLKIADELLDEDFYVQGHVTNVQQSENYVMVSISMEKFTYQAQTSLETVHYSSSKEASIMYNRFKGMLKYWIFAFRLPILVILLLPVLLTASFVVYSGIGLDSTVLFLVVLGLMMTQFGGVVFADYFDHRSLIDESNPYVSEFGGGFRFLKDGLLHPNRALSTSIMLFTAGLLVGIYLASINPNIIAFVFIGGLIAIFYAAEPVKLAYRGLGELSLSLVSGPLVMFGTFTVLAPNQSIPENFTYIVLPSLFISFLLIFYYSFQDKIIDELTGKKTLVVRIGESYARFLVIIIILLLLGITYVIADFLGSVIFAGIITILLILLAIVLLDLYQKDDEKLSVSVKLRVLFMFYLVYATTLSIFSLGI